MASTGIPSNNGNGVAHAHYTNGQDYASDGQYENGANYHNGNGYIHAHQQSHGLKAHQSTVSQVYNPQFFKFANPGPLGLISFALTTLVLGLFQCGAGLPDSNPFGGVGPDQAVFGLAVFFGGTAQFIAGLLEFRVGNTFGTTVHCSYGAFWLAFAMFLVPSLGIREAYAGNDAAYDTAVGIFLIAWCFLTIIFLVAALRTNIAILTVFSLLAMAFLLLSIAQFILPSHPTAAVRVNRAGGVFAVLDALAAFYAGAAGLMTEDTTWVRFPLGELPHTPRRQRTRDAEMAKGSSN
ncbi:hypothetical protein S7711_04313 [Stachybotrys chartarum IBT 7711]|uniref:Uncharacterized protein n=1 Tax=Stachybotrys chartarum (strain CBS 109288 / IBT 7711) TaxID=1280523 RepID=A0A084AJD6_STACB|nr:hypothetical protein S7711_04313 [Stachybotrys chartarum IBT 7711]KFA51152.1 hypothetical protein S40293_04778 [Stachybotrys chartarum IBT 40293]KFA75875.1 hypothetical protein S40288_01922 [Stachybotrys chartarum IBT 40288]